MLPWKPPCDRIFSRCHPKGARNASPRSPNRTCRACACWAKQQGRPAVALFRLDRYRRRIVTRNSGLRRKLWRGYSVAAGKDARMALQVLDAQALTPDSDRLAYAREIVHGEATALHQVAD